MIARCAFCARQYLSGYLGYPVTIYSTRLVAFAIMARLEAERSVDR